MDDREQLKGAQGVKAAIGRILLQEWDPIGVRDVPEAQDEYHGYVGGVYRLLASGASAQQVAEHLYKIQSERMGGIGVTPKRLLPVAEKLLRLPVALDDQESAGEQ